MTLEQRNILAQTIVRTGGRYTMHYSAFIRGSIMTQSTEVVPIRVIDHWHGRKAVQVMAVKGKPFWVKDDIGEGKVFRYKTAFKNVWPEELVPVTEGEAKETDRQMITE